MKYCSLILLVSILSCKEQISYPEGGFDYPTNVSGRDTNFYNYQLKDLDFRRGSLGSIYEYLFFKPFEEPNLSIKPQDQETFRLTYSTTFGESVIINLREDCIIVKKGRPHEIYHHGIDRLSKTEKLHLYVLKKYYPIDTTYNYNPEIKSRLDSLVKLYPQLLDSSYYYKLFEKTILPNGKFFEYQITKIPVTKNQFNNMVTQINSSGFWTLPYDIICDDPPADGYGFTLEANTKKKYKSVSSSGCPGDTTTFPKLCQKIIELAKMDNEILLDRTWKMVPVDPSNYK